MNEKYQKYINFIVDDIEAPYFENMKDSYGLKDSEYELVLSKVFNQIVIIEGNYVHDDQGNNIYYEDSTGYWYKYEYDNNGNLMYWGDSDGIWYKYEYDSNGNKIYREDSTGYWYKWVYDNQGNLIYRQDSNGNIVDNRYE